MPRISAEHEAKVRERIVHAAFEVFAEKGYHRATIADVVQRSGLSVGAIYTHFSGKPELFLQTCDLMSGRGLDGLAIRLAPLTDTAERLVAAISYYVETIDQVDGEPGQVSLVRAWAEATEEPGLRDMLTRRRERLVGATQLLLMDGVAKGDLPDWLDIDGFSRLVTVLLDGLLLQRVEDGDGFRPDEAVRRVRTIVDLLLAAARSTGEPPRS
jgi:AcrR family transcriptional regulator